MKKNQVFYQDGPTTVCLLLDEDKNVIARGLSIWSRAEEEFNLEEGRNMAFRRAKEAEGRQKDCAEIKLFAPRKAWCDQLSLSLAMDRFGGFKGYYLPELTNTERLLLERVLGGKGKRGISTVGVLTEGK